MERALGQSLKAILKKIWSKCIRIRRSLEFEMRNRLSSSSILDSNGPVLSMTTHGYRFTRAYLAIESIAAGRLKPSRCILWISEKECSQQLPQPLQRLVSRGLEIRLSEDLGPHTKYYPYIAEESAFQGPLVTADDDKIYPKDWLEKLVAAYDAEPNVIHCYRAHRMQLLGRRLAPYREWRPCFDRAPSHLNFVTGAAGAIYPPKFLQALKSRGLAFLKCCPQSDDIWLTANSLREGIKVAQVDSRYRRSAFSTVPGSQKESLYHSNVTGGGNDVQLLHTLTDEDLQSLIRLEGIEQSIS